MKNPILCGAVLGLSWLAGGHAVWAQGGPTPPMDIWASQGADAKQINIWWTPSPSGGAMSPARYELYRYTTFDPDYAVKQANVFGTNYADLTATPGLLYYYWVKAVNSNGQSGAFSPTASGYQALSPPQGVQASDGTYTGRVTLSWSPAVGASSYQVYRSQGAAPGVPELVFHTAGLTFTDTLVSERIRYWYQVQTRRGVQASAPSANEEGYLLGRPGGLSATYGTSANRVTVRWQAVAGATSYEIWRGTVPSPHLAQRIGSASGTSYHDTAATLGVIYHYWVKACSASETSALSASSVSGYAARDTISLVVSDLVLLPRVLPRGSHPALLSFRLSNRGPAALAAPDTALRLSLYLGTDSNIGHATLMGSVIQHVTLAANATALVRLSSPAGLGISAAPGEYYAFLRVEPVWPNQLANANAGRTYIQRSGRVVVAAAGQVHYWAVNDYDGDGITDLAVHDASRGAWSIRAIKDGRTLWEDGLFGGGGQIPAGGDYDGDRLADPALYDPASGLWQVMLSASGYAVASVLLDAGPDAQPFPADYDGDGKADPVVYQEATGLWTGRLSGSGYASAAGYLGGPGQWPVPGDYDGDGRWDLAIYQAATGRWFIRSARGTLLKWGLSWGGPGYRPVSGDFDGDGIWDLAIYHAGMGFWEFQTMAGDILEPTMNYWGGPGWMAASGDLNGDGLADQIIYQESSGRWNGITLDGYVMPDVTWGSAAAKPVQWP